MKNIYNYLCNNVVIYEDELQLGMMFPTHLWLAILWYNMLASDPGIPLPPNIPGALMAMRAPCHKIHLRIS